MKIEEFTGKKRILVWGAGAVWQDIRLGVRGVKVRGAGLGAIALSF